MFNKISEKGFHSFDLGEPDCWLEIDCRTIFDGPIYTGQLSLSASDGKTITLEPPSSLAASVIYKLPAILPTGSAYLQTDVSGNMSWSTGIGGNSNITGLNIGSGIGVFFAKSGDDLQFRTLVPGPGIIISSSFNQVYISASNFDGILSASNLGNGYGTFADVSGNLLRFKSLVAGPNITINQNSDELFISASTVIPGETNTASNLGVGEGVFSDKNGVDLRFKSLEAGPNLTLSSSGTTIYISGASPGEINTITNLGTGFSVYSNKVGSDFKLRSFRAGPNIVLSSSANEIHISASNIGEVNTASNIGSGFGFFESKVGNDLRFKTLIAGNDLQIVSSSQAITMSFIGSVGEVNTATNLGTGFGLFSNKFGSDLRFKSLVAGPNITINSNSNHIEISGSSPGEVNTGANLGSGLGVFSGKSGTELQFRSILIGPNLTGNVTANHIELSASAPGEVNTITNLGLGTGVYSSKSGSDLRLRSFVAGPNIVISSSANEIYISGSAVGETNTASNLNSSYGLFAQKSGVDLQFKTIAPGSGISFVSSSTAITISLTNPVGETNTASNLGSGAGPYQQKVGSDLQFRSFVAGPNVTINSNGTEIFISGANPGETNTASNLGTGFGTYSTKFGSDLRFKSFTAGPNITINSSSDYIEISGAAPGEVNTVLNLGNGAGVYASKSGVVFNLKSLVAGPNMIISSSGTEIHISGTAPGEVNTASNLGTGLGVYSTKVGSDLRFKSFVAGPNITVNSSSNHIEISGASPGEVNTVSNLGSGAGVFHQKSGVDFQLKSIVAGPNIVVSSSVNEIYVSGAAPGETNTASNLGTGFGTYSTKVGSDLRFKSFTAGPNITINSSSNHIEISASNPGEVNTASNLNVNFGLFAQKSGNDLQFKTLIAGTGITLASSSNDITISAEATSGEANTASNLGTGTGVFSGKSGVDLQFKSLVAGNNIAIESSPQGITMSFSGALGETNTISNLGTGFGVYSTKFGTDLRLKSLVAGPNITLSSSANEIFVSGATPGEVNTISNLGSGVGIYSTKVGSDLTLKSLVAGPNVTINTNANHIEISASNSGEANTASNLGSGLAVFSGKSGVDLQFKSILIGPNLTGNATANHIELSGAAPGEVNTASNLGSGTGVYSTKFGSDLRFKSLLAGPNVTINSSANHVEISASNPGETNTASNLNLDFGLFAQKSGTDLQFKTLVPGAGVSFVSSSTAITVSISGTGEANTASNLGTGFGTFAQKSSVDLQFKSLVAGPNIILSASANEIHISGSGGSGEVNTASNLGSGAGVYSTKVGPDLQFKSFLPGPNVTINTNANQIEISASNPGEVNTASNLGTGAGVYSTKLGSDLRFKSLVAGPNVTINSTSDQIEISGSSSGEANTASNLNPNFGLFAQKTGIDLQFKTLIAGSGITLVSSSNDITISSPGGSGEANTASNLGSGFGVYQQKSGVDLQFRSISAPTSSFGNINIVTSSTDIQIVSRPQSETIRMFEDWYAGSVTGHWNWLATNSGTGAATSLVSTGVDSTTIRAIGVIQSSTGTTATGRAAQGQNLVSWRLENLKNSVLEWRVAVPTLSTALQEFGISFGWLGLVTATAQTNGLYFFYNRLTHGDFWTTVSANGAVRTITASAVAVVANTWTKFRIETNSGLTQAIFYINDVLVREESTNLPIGTGKLVGPAQVIVKSVGTTAVTFLNDYIDLTAHHIVGR